MSPRRLTTAAIALVLAIVLTSCLTANQTRMVDLVNSSRRSSGKAAVTGDQAAASKAQKWAEHMARTGVVEHTGGGTKLDPSGLPKWCGVAENVGMAPSIDTVHAAWMKSASHKRNILGNYNRVGTGVVSKGGYVYAVQIFYRSC